MKVYIDLRRGLRAACVVATTACLCACGSGGSEETPSAAAVALGDPVSRTIGAAGGAVESTSLGVKVRLTFPADALASDTVVSMTPLQPAAGDALSLKLTPSGVFFAKTVTLALEYPAGTVPDKTAMLRQSLSGQDAFVVTSVDTTARTVSGQLTTFGGATLTALAAEGRKSALRATVQANPPADGGGTLTVSQLTSIDALIQSGQRRLDALVADERFGPAYALQVSLAALIQRSGEDGYTARAEPFLRAAHDSACAARARAIATSQAATITQFGQFKSLIEPILYWDAAAQRLGTGPCNGISTDSAAHAVIAKELAFAKLKMEQGRSPSDVAKPSTEVKDARAVISILRQLQRTDASAPSIQQADLRRHAAGLHARPMSLNLGPFAAGLQSEFIDPMLVPARNTAWKMARDNSSLAHYPILLDAFGPTAVLQQDAQYVRTSISVVARNGSGNIMSTTAMGVALVGDVPTEPVRTASLNARNASIEIGGSIGILNVDAGESESLQVTFDGVEVARISSSGDMLMGPGRTPSALTASSLLAAAGFPSDDRGIHTLRILRTGAANALRLGITDDVLVAVTLNFAPPASAASFVGRWTAVNTCANAGNDNEDVRVTVQRDGPGSETGTMSVSFLRISTNHHDSRFPVVIAGDLAAEAQAIAAGTVRLNIHAGSADYVSEVFAINTCDDRAPGGGGTGVVYITMSLVRE